MDIQRNVKEFDFLIGDTIETTSAIPMHSYAAGQLKTPDDAGAVNLAVWVCEAEDGTFVPLIPFDETVQLEFPIVSSIAKELSCHMFASHWVKFVPDGAIVTVKPFIFMGKS